jgi:hypothetical protein
MEWSGGTTDAPAPTHWMQHTRHCRHGLNDVTGYVVTFVFFNRVTGETRREDFVYIKEPHLYVAACQARGTALSAISTGESDATYAVIDTVYAGGHRPV